MVANSALVIPIKDSSIDQSESVGACQPEGQTEPSADQLKYAPYVVHSVPLHIGDREMSSGTRTFSAIHVCDPIITVLYEAPPIDIVPYEIDDDEIDWLEDESKMVEEDKT